MDIIRKSIDGLFELVPSPKRDNRGSFARLMDLDEFQKAGFNTNWVQESLSHTDRRYTVRGLHVSLPPSLEGKTVTALRGRMQWVCVDLRKNSGTFGGWESFILSEELNNSLYAEKGFAHGCLSLADDCDLLLRADNFFSAAAGTGIIWNDSALEIDWRLDGHAPLVSQRDSAYPGFSEFLSRFSAIEVNR